MNKGRISHRLKWEENACFGYRKSFSGFTMTQPPNDPLGENFVKVLCIDWNCRKCKQHNSSYCRLQCEHRPEHTRRQEYDQKTDFHIRAANAKVHNENLNTYFE